MKLDKLVKKLGLETVGELDALPKEGVRDMIVQAEQSMKKAREELEANPVYQELRENLKAVTGGMRELNSRQKAIINYCLYKLSGE